ncbi:MAG: RecQ family ATP-dependent DNA helicase [Dehalococcoidia bacterium]
MPSDRSLEAALADRFGFAAFRPGQREIVEAALAGRDVLAIMPTGGGKSLTFQLPALLGDGVTLVISPLIALMKDQVDRLAARLPGSATFLNSTVRSVQARKRLARAEAGEVRLLYIAPERLRSPSFREAVGRMTIERIVVDEAHCVSEWGHDFRPEYLAIRAFADDIGRPPILALTATATPTARADIQRQLGLDHPAVIVAPLDRPNLRFSVLPVPRKTEKTSTLKQLAGKLEGSGIVYTGTRRDAEDVANSLSLAGESAIVYHAGMTAKARAAAQDQFLTGERRIVVATNAFGLGIDKPDVRFVIHFAMPATPEAYFQEAGRAGRDGGLSCCILLFAPVDIGIQRFLVQRDVPDEQAMLDVLAKLRRGGSKRVHADLEAIAIEMGVSELLVRLAVAGLERGGALVRGPDEFGKMTFEQLRRSPDPKLWVPVTIDAERRRRRRLSLLWKIWDYAKTDRCRRAWWLRYFGDRTPPPPIEGCCDVCDPAGEPIVEITPVPAKPNRRLAVANRPTVPALDESERIATVLRLVEALDGSFGRQGVATILRGRLPKAADPTVVERAEFGALAGVREADVHTLIDSLVLAGWLNKDSTARPRLRLTASGRKQLASPARVRQAVVQEERVAWPDRRSDLIALARSPGPDGMSALMAALDDPDRRVRSLALAGIRRLALGADIPAETRREARVVLRRIG